MHRNRIPKGHPSVSSVSSVVVGPRYQGHHLGNGSIPDWIGTCLLGLATWFGAAGAAAEPGEIDFNRDIRSILADTCFECHGPDKESREGELRLDTEAGALKVITPGDPDQSELVARLFSSDPEERMPPPKSKRKPSQAPARTPAPLGRRGRFVRRALGVRAARPRSPAPGRGRSVAAQRHRSVCVGEPGDKEAGSPPRRPARGAGPTPQPRPHRTPAPAGANANVHRRLRTRPGPNGPTLGGRTPRLAGLRRTRRLVLDGRRPLRRHQRATRPTPRASCGRGATGWSAA